MYGTMCSSDGSSSSGSDCIGMEDCKRYSNRPSNSIVGDVRYDAA